MVMNDNDIGPIFKGVYKKIGPRGLNSIWV